MFERLPSKIDHNGPDTDAPQWQALASEVLRLVRHIGRDLRDQENVAGDAMLKIIASFDRMQQQVNKGAYVYTIVENLVIDTRRRAGRRPVLDSSDAEVHYGLLADRAPSPERVLLAKENHARLKRAIDQLDARSRNVVRSYCDDLSSIESSIRHGESPANIDQIVSRAMRELRAILTPAATGPPGRGRQKPRNVAFLSMRRSSCIAA
jgi:RNA polymerase sigma factor (sigma-70 family)